MVGTQNLEVLKPIDKVSLGEITSHRAVTTVNADVASKMQDPRAEPASVGRRQHGMPKSDRCGIPPWRGESDSTVTRTHRVTGEALLAPDEKSPEQGRSYNWLNREVDRRREGDGWVRSR